MKCCFCELEFDTEDLMDKKFREHLRLVHGVCYIGEDNIPY